MGSQSVTDQIAVADAALLSAIRDGDAGAWNALVDRYADKVWSVAASTGLDHADAEDVCRLTWMRFRDQIEVAIPPAPGAWLEQTAERECTRAAAFALSFGPARRLVNCGEGAGTADVLPY